MFTWSKNPKKNKNLLRKQIHSQFDRCTQTWLHCMDGIKQYIASENFGVIVSKWYSRNKLSGVIPSKHTHATNFLGLIYQNYTHKTNFFGSVYPNETHEKWRMSPRILPSAMPTVHVKVSPYKSRNMWGVLHSLPGGSASQNSLQTRFKKEKVQKTHTLDKSKLTTRTECTWGQPWFLAHSERNVMQTQKTGWTAKGGCRSIMYM